MEIVFYFVGFGSVIMLIMLKYDVAQSSRLNKILKESKNVQPLFLQRSAEQNLRVLNTKLYGTMGSGINTVPAGRVNMDEAARQLLAADLSRLVNEYNTGQLPLKNYNEQLNHMLDMVNEVKAMNFNHV